MKFLKSLFAMLVIAIIFNLLQLNVAWAEENDEVTILFTHDLHDNYNPFEVERDGEKILVGGLARMYEAIVEQRKTDPNAILIDAGDFSMGTLYQTIFSTHAPMMRLMGMMEYDAITYGNHEFDFRPEGLSKALNAAQESGDELPPIIASNIVYPKNEQGEMAEDIEQLKQSMEEYGVEPYRVIEKNGIKIGMFGLLGKDAASNAPMSGVTFDDNVEVSKKMVKVLKEEENVDLIIAASHSGTSPNPKKSEDELLAKEVPEIDFIVSGHSHTTLHEAIVINETVIGSAGEYGENLGLVKLHKNDDNRWDLQDYEIIRIDDRYPENNQMSKKIDTFKKDVQKQYLDLFDLSFDEVIAHTSFDFSDFSKLGEHQESTIGNLIGDAYIEVVKELEGEDYEPITASVIPVGVIRNSFYEGDITVSDVFNVSSLGIGPDAVSGYPVVDVYLTGKELKTVAEVDASVAPLMPAAQLYIAGLQYTFNPNRLIFNKVTDVNIETPEGSLEDIDDDRLYRLVAGLYTGQMLPIVGDQSYGLLSIEPKNKDGEVIDDFEEQIIYMNNGQELKEWHAIAQYLMSFEKVDGIPEVPEHYADVKNRKNVESSKNPIDLLKNPNGISWTVYSIVAVILLGIFFLISWFIKRKKR